jgi:mono/diheme cytochrome c family protein
VKTFFIGVVAGMAAIPAVLLCYFVLGLAPMQSDASPGRLETAVMGSAVRASIHRSVSGSAEGGTSAGSEQAVIAGGKLYMQGCAGCHGELGKPYQEDKANFPRVPQLPHSGTQYSEAEVQWIIKHGIRMTAMSAYGPFYKEDQLRALATFIKQIDRLPTKTLESILAKGPADSNRN